MQATSRFCPFSSLPSRSKWISLASALQLPAIMSCLYWAILSGLSLPVVLVAAEQLTGLVGGDEAVVPAALVEPPLVELA
jgi:hypothetical protein